MKENASQYTNEFLENILKEKKETEQIDILYRGLKNYLDLNYICTKEMENQGKALHFLAIAFFVGI